LTILRTQYRYLAFRILLHCNIEMTTRTDRAAQIANTELRILKRRYIITLDIAGLHIHLLTNDEIDEIEK